MNALQRELKNLVPMFEKNADFSGKWRLNYHLMPPVGWLNDPNGLCYYKGEYYFFFQYSPFSARGGLKFWGLYKSADLINWRYIGAPLMPDTPFDCHGAYSGSALPDGDKLRLYYTGNVKLWGDYNFITTGRKSNTLYAEMRDDVVITKKLLFENKDYPDDLTLHVRDPKVWREDGKYYMALGARDKNDKGLVLIYASDKADEGWELLNRITAKDAFGYMWECPDLFTVDGETLLSVSPQGVEADGFKYNNVYQSGYFKINGDFKGDYVLSDFEEWDCGFDFYAPQTFTDGKRRILVGWLGLPDIDDLYSNPTAELPNPWQHALTIPREISVENGEVVQKPVEEMRNLRKEKITFSNNFEIEPCFEFYAENINSDEFSIALDGGFVLEYKDGTLYTRFTNDIGRGRDERATEMPVCRDIRLFADNSSVEVFADGGRKTFSSRFYPENGKISVDVTGLKKADIWRLKGFN